MVAASICFRFRFGLGGRDAHGRLGRAGRDIAVLIDLLKPLQVLEQLAAVGVALDARGCGCREDGAEHVDALEQDFGAVRVHLQRAVAHLGEVILGGGGDGFEHLEGEEAARAFDGVERPYDPGENLDLLRIFLEDDEILIELVEPLLCIRPGISGSARPAHR
ncbi:MAG: hypothetical protein R3F21_22960 [Myxococcota bacterium]